MSRLSPDVAEEGGSFSSCSICMHDYDDREHQPKLLPCQHGHSYCKTCLVRLLGTKNFIHCPSCRKKIVMGERGIDELQTNYYIVYIKSLQRQKKGGGDYCKVHPDRRLVLFCKTCNETVCRDCTARAHNETQGHVIIETKQALIDNKHTLQEQIGQASQVVVDADDTITSLRNELSNMATTELSMTQSINDLFDEFEQKLQNQRQIIKDKIKAVYGSQSEAVQSDLNQIKELSTHVNIAMKNSNTALQNNILDEILSNTTSNALALNDMTDALRKAARRQHSKHSLQLDASTSKELFDTTVKDLGRFVAIQAKPPTACLATSIKLVLPEGAKINVMIKDSNGEHVKSRVTEGNDAYYLHFRPMKSGKHKLFIDFKGKTTSRIENPFTVKPNNPLLKVGEQGIGPKKFDGPAAVAVGKNGDIFVADFGNHTVQWFGASGDYLHSFPIGKRISQTEMITASALVATGLNELVCNKAIYVYKQNMWNLKSCNTITFYGPQGHLLQQVSSKSLKQVHGVAINSLQHIIASDLAQHKIFILTRKGSVLKTIGKTGGGSIPGQFRLPKAVCVGPNDEIIVSDSDNHRIQVLTKDGTFLNQFNGNDKFQLKSPNGVAADPHGHVLVCDWSDSSVKVFTMEGTFVGQLESTSERMMWPRGLAIAPPNHTIVADSGNHCIKAYKYM
ncbi:unnamed protein product [Owenia fusiformis]|uniref:Uncharacterized protein n=1 Tax=Owenia fusiformis TaxID=6347 RepID=A0A8J1U9Q8_OWEFU|nr:unnamed protein product [Owenia fusiformis]